MKKRLFSLLLVFALLLGSSNLHFIKEVHAEDNLIANGTDWELREDGTLIFTGNYVKDYSTASNAPWYDYREQITAFETETATRIGDYAFYGCLNLERIDFSRIYDIGDYAFYGCKSLKSIYFDTEVQIGNYAFQDCDALTEISIPAEVVIGEYAFIFCDSLKSIRISTSERISNDYFKVPVNSLPDNEITFYYVKGQNIYYDVKTGELGTKFHWEETLNGYCGYQVTWNYDENTKTLIISGNGAVMDYYGGSETPWNIIDGIKYVVVEEGITEIPSYFFEYQDTMENISLPNTLELLSRNAFNDCSSLNNLLLPGSIKSFHSNSDNFNRCSSLTDVYYKGTAEEWAKIEYIRGVELDSTDSTPFQVHYLEYYEGQPAGCEEDGYESYYMFDDTSVYPQIYAEDRTIIDEPVSIPAIGHNYGEPEFVWAENYESCVAEFRCGNCNEVLSVDCIVTYENIPATDTQEEKIIYKAKAIFQNSTHTATVVKTVDHTIAQGLAGEQITWTLTDDGLLTFKGKGAMKNYSNKTAMPWYEYFHQITSIIIEEGVTTIGEFAFYGMPVLENITIPESVTNIGAFAFKNANALKNVTLPSRLTQLGESAFYACASLTSIDIPASLWTVKPYTFKNCTSLDTVTFHEGNLMKISDGAFYNTAVKEVILPDCLDILDVYVFKNCANLANVTFGKGITEVREAALYGTAISELTIPDNITKIKSYAFKNCKNLASVDLGSGLTFIGEAGFYECTALTNLSIPRGVTDIQGYAFKKCTGLEMISLPSTLTTIGESAFHTCTGLESILIPKNVNGIGGYCFSGSGLKEITFQGSAPKIGDGAFKGLTVKAYYPEEEKSWTDEVMVDYGGNIVWEAE